MLSASERARERAQQLEAGRAARFGKTSLLRRALHDAQREGWAAVEANWERAVRYEQTNAIERLQ